MAASAPTFDPNDFQSPPTIGVAQGAPPPYSDLYPLVENSEIQQHPADKPVMVQQVQPMPNYAQPQTQQPMMHSGMAIPSHPAPVSSQTIIVNAGGNCPRCHTGILKPESNSCARCCCCVLILLTFPFGLLGCCCCPAETIFRCPSCKYRS